MIKLSTQGNYGSEVDTPTKPRSKKKKGDGDDEESELIHGSSDEEMDTDGDMTSVSTTPPMKPVITDRSDPTVSSKTTAFISHLCVLNSSIMYIFIVAEIISTCPISRGSPVSVSRAGGRTRDDGFIILTSWTILQINW